MILLLILALGHAQEPAEPAPPEPIEAPQPIPPPEVDLAPMGPEAPRVEVPAAPPSAADLPSAPALPYLPVLPWFPLRGGTWALMLAMLTGLALACAAALDRARDQLLSTGFLPRMAATSQAILRVLAVFTGLGAIAAIVPASLAPALPVVVLGGALAIGWSARDVLPDLVGGITLLLERRIAPGQWLSGGGYTGVVESLGVRATWLRDPSGKLIAVPNHELLRLPVSADTERHPTVEVTIVVPTHLPAPEARRHLEEVALLTPWTSPHGTPVATRDATAPGHWRVRTRLLEGRFVEQFEGALQEHLDDLTRAPTPPTPEAP